MDTSAIDLAALATAIVLAAVITAVMLWAHATGGMKRTWIVALVIGGLLIVIGVVDLMRERPRETHLATVFIGVPLPVLGAVAFRQMLRRVRPWLRWSVVFLVTLLLLLCGVLLGGAIAPRWLGA